MAAVTRRTWRLAAGGAVVAGLFVAVGAGPVLRGVASVSAPAIAASLVLTAVATAAAAWRWRIIAARLGLALPWTTALAAYYRSQFMNTVLPGGVVGDIHRAYAHGRAQGAVGAAARAVAAERLCGQIVQLGVAAAILIPLGFASALAPVAWSAVILGIALSAGVAVALGVPRARRALAGQLHALRPLLSRPGSLGAVAGASLLVVAAHVAMFLLAGLAVGTGAGPSKLAPLGLAVLCASAIPLNVGGWGPREAASAAIFALAGLSGATGVAVSTAFGLLGAVAVAPGALVLLGERMRVRRRARRSEESA